MRRIFIFLLLLATLFLSETFADEQLTDSGRLPEDTDAKMKEFLEKRRLAEEKATKKLDGREVLVRIYNNWEESRLEFEEVYIQLDGNLLKLDFDIDEGAVAVVLKGDQDDEVVKGMLGLQPVLLRSQRLRFPPMMGYGGTKKVWIFKDGAGNPVSLANGEIFYVDRDSDKKEPKWAASFILNEEGQCRWRYTNDSKMSYYYIILSHPDYGVHRFEVPSLYKVKPWYAYEEYEYYLPRVPEGTKAYERSIRGFIVDDANNPIAGATIESRFLYTPDRRVVTDRGLFKDADCLLKVHTDENGWFCMYLPTEEYIKDRPIPLNSNYNVRIEVPKEYGLVPFVGEITNGAERIIKMDQYGYFRTFVFVDEDGLVTDPNKLRQNHLRIYQPGEARLDYDYGDFKNGGYFPLGTYSVWTNYGVDYEPIEVTEESPEELVFKLPAGITYIGHVVHGLTCEPMEDAFVIAVKSGRGNNFSNITTEQWGRLRELGDKISVDEKVLGGMKTPIDFKDGSLIYPDESNYTEEYIALKPLARFYGFEKGARTDPNGRFEISFRTGEVFHRFVAFEEDYLGIGRVKQGLEPDSNRRAEVPVMPLFPAATVKLEVLADGKNCWVKPYWLIDTNSLPEWAAKSYEDESYEDVVWPDEAYLADSNGDFESEQAYLDIVPNPNIILLYIFYDFMTTSRISFFGIPVRIHQHYNFAWDGEPFEIDANDNAIWMDETFNVEPNENLIWSDKPFELPKEDPNKVPTFYEVYEDLFWTFEYAQAWPANKVQTLQVPAGLDLNLLFYEDNDRLPWVPVTFPQTINLKQGEVLDMGTYEMERAIQVFVKVVDSTGKPVAGIPVRNWFRGEGWQQTHHADENGRAKFYVNPYMGGMFYVTPEKQTGTYFVRLSKSLDESVSKFEAIPYEMGGEEDAGREFTLPISDEMLDHLSK